MDDVLPLRDVYHSLTIPSLNHLIIKKLTGALNDRDVHLNIKCTIKGFTLHASIIYDTFKDRVIFKVTLDGYLDTHTDTYYHGDTHTYEVVDQEGTLKSMYHQSDKKRQSNTGDNKEYAQDLMNHILKENSLWDTISLTNMVHGFFINKLRGEDEFAPKPAPGGGSRKSRSRSRSRSRPFRRRTNRKRY